MVTVNHFSSSLARFDRCKKMSRIFMRTELTFVSTRNFGVINVVLGVEAGTVVTVKEGESILKILFFAVMCDKIVVVSLVWM